MEEEIITLQSCDGKDFKITYEKAKQLETVANIIEDIGTDETIPLPAIDSVHLKQIVAFTENPTKVYSVKKEDFVEAHKLLTSVNYINFHNMLEVLSDGIAKSIEGATAEEMQKMAGVAEKFTKEDEEAVQREQDWIED